MPFGRMGLGVKKKGAIKGMYYPSRFSAQRKLGSKMRLRMKMPGVPRQAGISAKLPGTNAGIGKLKI